MSKIESRLWADLERLHASGDVVVGGQRRAPARRRIGKASLVATALGGVGAATAAMVALSIGGAAAAYAVSKASDGSVTVTLNELAGVAGANAQLENLGVAVRVVKVEAGCNASTPNQEGVGFNPAEAATISSTGSVTVQPTAIPAGDTLVLTAQEINGHVANGLAAVRGAAPACVAPATEMSGVALPPSEAPQQ